MIAHGHHHGFNQPKPFSRTGSAAVIHQKTNPTKHHVASSHATDDEDWISSSSAVASPAPEPENEEEDSPIYVNPNVHHRSNVVDEPPATPTMLNHRLPNQRHHVPSQVMAHDESNLVPDAGGIHPTNATPQRHQNHVRTEPSHIHFATEHQEFIETHPTDPRIHQNGTLHHVSPPPQPPTASAAAPTTTTTTPGLVPPGTSVIRISERNTPDQSSTRVEEQTQLNGKKGDRQKSDELTSSNRRTSARLQDQIDTSNVRQIAANHSVRPAVSGNNADANGGHHHHPAPLQGGIGDIGRTSQQRGFGAVANPALEQHQHKLDYDTTHAPPPPPLVPATTSEAGTNSRPIRPSMLRRDTTPTAISRSPVTIDTPPRASTPPASMTHDEMVANNYKRHSIHSTGGHARPLSLFQPTSSSHGGKRLSLTSRPSSTHYGLGQLQGKNNPLALLIRLNPGSNLAAPPVVSPSYDGGDRDSESAYVAMSPTRTRSLRKKASASSLNSIATAPVISTTSATASGSSASPTSALATSSSAILKHLSTSAHSADGRSETLRPDDRPLFVSQFYPTNGNGNASLPGQSTGKRRERSIGQKLAGTSEWRSHETAMKHRGLMTESFNRISAAQASASAGSRRR